MRRIIYVHILQKVFFIFCALMKIKSEFILILFEGKKIHDEKKSNLRLAWLNFILIKFDNEKMAIELHFTSKFPQINEIITMKTDSHCAWILIGFFL